MKVLILLSIVPLLLAGQDRAGAVAVVNGEVITRWDLEKLLKADPRYREIERSYQGEAFRRHALPIEKDVLKVLIQQKLVEQEIEKRKTRLEPEDEAEVERLHEESIRKYGSEEVYRLALQNSGLSEEDELRWIRLRVLMDKMLRREFGPEPFVSPKELRETYDRLESEVEERGFLEGPLEEICRKGGLRVRQIKLSRQDRDLAEAIRKRAVQGEDFAALAREHSRGPRGEDGGLWVFEGPEAPFTERRAEAIDALEPGETSEIVEDRDALYIIRLESRSQPRLLPFQDVRQTLHQHIARNKRAEEQKRWFEEIMKRSHIVNYLEEEAPPPPGRMAR